MNGEHFKGDESGLLRGLASHGEEALKSLYDQYFPMVARMVTGNHGSADDAQDLFQEALIVLYEKARDPEFILECKLKTYLYAVCRHLWLKQLHQRQKQFVVGEDGGEDIPGDLEEDLEMHREREGRFRIMGDSLEKLGQPCRSLLEHFYIQQLSMQEIAEKFGYTNPENAKTQKYKCLNRLKKIFFDQYK